MTGVRRVLFRSIFKNIYWESSSKTLNIDWSVNSPSWNLRAQKLGLNSDNLFKSLATKKYFYYAGTEENSQILNYYMNDHAILRGKLCEIKDIQGLKLFTYQAKEKDC